MLHERRTAHINTSLAPEGWELFVLFQLQKVNLFSAML